MKADEKVKRIAVVYEDQTRPETTGVYCRRALETLAAVSFFHPSRLNEVPRDGFDLYLNIDDGMRYLWPDELRPAAWWAIDTHLDCEWALAKARGFDFVFAAQRDGAERLRTEGIASAVWLPLACDEEVHAGEAAGPLPTICRERTPCRSAGSEVTSFGDSRNATEGAAYRERNATECVPYRHRNATECVPYRSAVEGLVEIARLLPEEKRFDVCFVGNVFPGARGELVRLIERQFKKVFVGRAYFEEMTRIYRASKVVFNRSVKNDVNMRAFEALASGSLLMTNDLADNGLAELFRDGVHLATYRDQDELLDKLRYYLSQHAVREKIAAAGRAEVLAKHTYRHRMEEVLRRVGDCRPARREPMEGDARVGEEHDARGEEGKGQERPDGLGSPSSDLSYFDFARPGVLQLVPAEARRVLEIGCGTGRLGEALKGRQACEVVGIELDGGAAKIAAARLDRVLVGDVKRLALDFSPGEFDCLICADVLEHLVDPAGFLRRARACLTEGASVVASIPNVRHQSVVASLIEGNWTYEPAGLLDNTHLRFFTRRDAEDLFVKSGYEIERMWFVPGPGYDEWRRGDMSRVRIGGVELSGVPREEAEEFFVYQFLLRAKIGRGVHQAEPDVYSEVAAGLRSQIWRERTPCRSEGSELTSLGDARNDSQSAARRERNATEGVPCRREQVERDAIADRPHPGPLPEGEGEVGWPRCLLLMVTYNRLEYTRLAVEAVLKLDYPNLRIVFWDNASNDGTVEYLRNRLSGVPHAPLVASPVNRGVVFPMNEVWASDGGGLHHAERDAYGTEAELLAKIDNDTLVPPDLLKRLAACHVRSERFGVLSGFHFRKEGESLAEEHWIKSFDGVSVLPQPYVGGCAVMLRREVFERLGAIACRGDGPLGRPFMDSGWTVYQQRLTDEGLINGYPWPPIHVDHMEDTRSPHSILSAEHQRYKQLQRGMCLEDFTRELCVWRPN